MDILELKIAYSSAGNNGHAPEVRQLIKEYEQLQQQLAKANLLNVFYEEGLEKSAEELTAAQEREKRLRKLLSKALPQIERRHQSQVDVITAIEQELSGEQKP